METEAGRIRTYFELAREREQIRRRRLAGNPPPWTADPVLQRWRICNVRREDDRTTMWFREHVRDRLEGWRVIEATMRVSLVQQDRDRRADRRSPAQRLGFGRSVPASRAGP